MISVLIASWPRCFAARARRPVLSAAGMPGAVAPGRFAARAGSVRAGSTPPPPSAARDSGTNAAEMMRGPTVSPLSVRRRSSRICSGASIAEKTVVKPASRNSRMLAADCSASQRAGSPCTMWRCASMKPGITVRPPASMRTALAGAPEALAPTAAMRPSRTTTVPRSMALPVPSRMRALLITRSCAAAGRARQQLASSASPARFFFVHLNPQE